jgi:radical SAM superfamily enzyme YgiQ (UPF0313 family)
VVLLIGTYDLGRQPFGLASPAAWLRRAGVEVTAVDLTRQSLPIAAATSARLVAFYLPMHTATRLALPVVDRVRALNPSATICAYGLYAPLNEAILRQHGVSVILGPEAEAELARMAAGAAGPAGAEAPALQTKELGKTSGTSTTSTLPKLEFIQPDRHGLPALNRYASLTMPDGTRKVVGATEATRGCKHRCRHCPIVPIYDGQFRVVPLDVVLADIRAQVEQGATHITFGDPDFFNGPTHARRIVEALHRQYPDVTYDVIIKVEHLLDHRALLPVLAESGCLFVTSAVESVDDSVLAKLEKGHTRADFVDAVSLCREAGLTLSPTFVPFSPWTTMESYRQLLDTIEELDLVEHVAPVQWGIRLLVTWGSRLLELPEIRGVIRPFDPKTLTYPWAHPDSRVDALQRQVMALAGVKVVRSRTDVFTAVRNLSEPPDSGLPIPVPAAVARTAIPYMNEPWYC